MADRFPASGEEFTLRRRSWIASDPSRALVIVHGLGSGALRDAARRYLAESPYTRRFVPGAPDEGGDGVTIAHLE